MRGKKFSKKDSPDIATLGVPESFASQAAETDWGFSRQAKIGYARHKFTKVSLSRRLDIQLKQRQIYTADLEIHFLERDLQIPHRFLQITPNLDTGANLTVVEDDMNSEEMFNIDV
ncbi:hypothetical protein Ddc_22816 [Ditylenchus destructor]|nr:hypothetical protein Ddc_22816 [Ditylenchus destructor]